MGIRVERGFTVCSELETKIILLNACKDFQAHSGWKGFEREDLQFGLGSGIRSRRQL